MFVGNVRIYLRRGNVGMAKERLYAAQVGAIFEQVGSKGVADNVRSYFARNARKRGIFFNNPLDAARCDAQLFGTFRGFTHLYKECIVHVSALCVVTLY